MRLGLRLIGEPAQVSRDLRAGLAGGFLGAHFLCDALQINIGTVELGAQQQ